MNFSQLFPVRIDEFFSTVPGMNFDLCIISTRSKHIYPSEKYSTSSEVPQNHNHLPSTVSLLATICQVRFALWHITTGT